ncbi:MAG: hypothetical protein JRI86_13705 [Deltaproteobacteria bacterium]|nr:hypothetical protein [Deltaproteobacteria bacterium]
MPDIYLFRHIAGQNGLAERKYGSKFGDNYLWKYWHKACKNLGINGVDLYGGTKHSTVTAAREYMTPEEIRKDLTGHRTNAAFDRYLQVDAAKERTASQKIRSKGKVIKMDKNCRPRSAHEK